MPLRTAGCGASPTHPAAPWGSPPCSATPQRAAEPITGTLMSRVTAARPSPSSRTGCSSTRALRWLSRAPTRLTTPCAPSSAARAGRKTGLSPRKATSGCATGSPAGNGKPCVPRAEPRPLGGGCRLRRLGGASPDADTSCMRITIRVKPGSARPGVGGEHDGALIVRVSARAVDGKATEAALAAVAESFGIRSSTVRLVSGASSRTKVIDVGAVDPLVLAALLAAPGRLLPRHGAPPGPRSLLLDARAGSGKACTGPEGRSGRGCRLALLGG